MAEQARTWFAPVALAGLGSAAVLAVSAARDWFRLGGDRVALGIPESELRADMPLALALSLVVLAAWGVVLVTGAAVRRVVLVLGGIAALGVIACLVRAPFLLPDQIRARVGFSGGRAAEPTAAYLIACVAVPAVLALVVLAWRLAPRWPEMSSRYDAPSAAGTSDAPAEDLADLELWKALDEGHDPTER